MSPVPLPPERLKRPSRPRALFTPSAGFSIVVVAIAVQILTACAAPQAPITPEGRLDVLAPNPGFSTLSPPADWVVVGNVAPSDPPWSVAPFQGVPALKVVNGKAPFIVARRTEALVLATPFLSWAWNVGPYANALHPLRLIVGFDGGAQKGKRWDGKIFQSPGSTLPVHDRTISFVWGRSALKRGELIVPPPDKANDTAPYYIVRGGRENTGQWWLETVDLSDLYARAWPHDNIEKVRVVFIGIAAEAKRRPSSIYFSGIRLSH